MCGITGVINHQNKFGDLPDILNHRGPNNRSVWKDDHVILDHYRLSIIDLDERANQPFKSEFPFILIYNGEIYNYQELQKNYLQEFNFKTTSDTEVLYYGLIKYGKDFLNKLNGMFTFAFYDIEKKQTLLARDRFGIKPLYFFKKGESTIFSSEQKAIYSLMESEEKEVDREVLKEFFSFKYVYGKRTLAKNIYEVDPGSLLEIIDGKIIEKKWYHPPTERTHKTSDLVEKVEEELKKSVQRRLISDVPVGLQLSGGIDSSLIAKMVRHFSSAHLKSFFINFEHSEHSEEKYADHIAKKLDIDHHSISFGEKDFLDLWEKCVYHNDEPLNHPHSVPIYKLSHVASQDVTVLLSGEGADESFLGYEQYLQKISINDPREILFSTRFIGESDVCSLLHKDFHQHSILGERESLVDLFKKGNGFSLYEFKTHLVTLLNRIDKMSMASSIEVRVPFLDHQMVEIGLAECSENLISQQNRKIPLMNLYEQYFKDGFSQRKKVGFRVPYNEWLQTSSQFQEFTQEYLHRLLEDSYLNRSFIVDLIDDVEKKKINERTFRLCWILTNYSLWKKVFSF